VCSTDTVSRHAKQSYISVIFPIWTATGANYTAGFVYSATCVEGILCVCLCVVIVPGRRLNCHLGYVVTNLTISYLSLNPRIFVL